MPELPPWLYVVITVGGLMGSYYLTNKLTGSAGRTASAAEVQALAASLEKERTDRDTSDRERDASIRELREQQAATQRLLDVETGRARSWAVFGHAMLQWAARHDFSAPLPEPPDQADPWTGFLL